MLRILGICALSVMLISFPVFSQEIPRGTVLSPDVFFNADDTPNRDAIIEQIIQTAKQYGVKMQDALSIAQIESNFNPDARRYEPKLKTYSLGLFQLLIPTAQSLGFQGTNEELLDPMTNITLGVQYISMCYANSKTSERDLACCYQAGLFASDWVCRNNAMVRSYTAQFHKLRPQWVAYMKAREAGSLYANQ